MTNVEIVKLMFSQFKEETNVVENKDGSIEAGVFLFSPCKIRNAKTGRHVTFLDGWEVEMGIPPTGDVVELGKFWEIKSACKKAVLAWADANIEMCMDRISDEGAAEQWNAEQEELKKAVSFPGRLCYMVDDGVRHGTVLLTPEEAELERLAGVKVELWSDN